MDQFDKQVKALRGKVEPKTTKKKKCDCTPEEWAAKLDYQVKGYDERWREYAGRKRLERVSTEEQLQRKRRRRREDYQKNKERYREQGLRYTRERRRSDPVFRAMLNHRRRVRDHVKGRIKKVSASWSITHAEFMKYIEAKFDKGMTWENYGSYWDLDHIFPLSKIDVSCEYNQLAAFHYKNLQPLHWEKNRKQKRDGVTPETQAHFKRLIREVRNAKNRKGNKGSGGHEQNPPTE